MKCEICNDKKVNNDRLGIFEKDYNNLCNKCMLKYKPGLYLTKIPINKAYIWHFYLYEKQIPNSITKSLNQKLRPLYFLCEHYKKTVIFLDDNLDYDELENLINLLDRLDFGDLIMLSYSPIEF